MKKTEKWFKYFLGIRQRHTYWMYKVIDDILNENKQIGGIIETGTGKGALSIFLGLECYERGYKPLLTYDILDILKPKLFDLLGIKFIVRDCFEGSSIEEIRNYADIPILLMCDGGNKKKEFNAFTRYLKQGSIVAAHDWNTEIKLEHIQNTINRHEMKPLHEEEWDSPPDHIRTCFWRKVK